MRKFMTYLTQILVIFFEIDFIPTDAYYFITAIVS